MENAFTRHEASGEGTTSIVNALRGTLEERSRLSTHGEALWTFGLQWSSASASLFQRRWERSAAGRARGAALETAKTILLRTPTSGIVSPRRDLAIGVVGAAIEEGWRKRRIRDRMDRSKEEQGPHLFDFGEK